MSDYPKISVVMPVFNAEHFVSNSIESILNQSYKNFEFIIIDDGSSDKTDIVLNYYRTKDLELKFSNIVIKVLQSL